jgi:transposase-like protein
MREMSVSEQRSKAVLALIAEGRTVTQVARDWDVARQTVHVWLERHEADGLEGVSNRSHGPAHCAHQAPATAEAQPLEGCVWRSRTGELGGVAHFIVKYLPREKAFAKLRALAAGAANARAEP